MNSIKEALSSGERRSLGRTEETVSWVLSDKERLPELFECLFDDDEVVRMRAGDGLEKVCRQNPKWLVPYTERLITEVSNIKQPSVQWHLAQILSEVPLNTEDKAKAIALLKHNLENYGDWIVINLTLEALAKFAREEQSLSKDFQTILEKYKNSPHKSVVSRVRKLLKEFTEE